MNNPTTTARYPNDTAIRLAVEAAVDEIRSFPYWLFSDEREHWINIVTRRLAPLLEQVTETIAPRFPERKWLASFEHRADAEAFARCKREAL